MHDSIGVKSYLARRGMIVDTTCPLCQTEVETITHALRDCSMAKAVWHQLGIRALNSTFFTQNLKDWLDTNGRGVQVHNPFNLPWNVLFLFAFWGIWRQRNNYVFNHRSSNPNLVRDIVAQASEFFLCADQSRSNRCKCIRKIRWEKPEVGWMKLNTNGASDSLLGLVGGGGLIRDEDGRWVAGFARKIGKANSFLVELWAFRDGLVLCQQMSVPTLDIELDAKALVEAFTNPGYSNSVVSGLFEDCKQLVTWFPKYRIKHVFREANMCADQLARLGCFQVPDFTLYSSPPVDIIKTFEADSQGLFSNKLCIVSSCFS